MSAVLPNAIVTRWRAIHGIAVARGIGDFGTALVIWALIFRERDQGPIAVSALFIAAGLPYILLGPWAGWLADRFSTKQIIPVLSVAQVALTLVFIVEMPFWALLGVIFLYNVAGAIDSPAWQSVLPEIATPEDLTRAYGISLGYTAVANIASPVAAGVLVATTGYVWPFVIDAVTFALLAFVPFVLKVNRAGHRPHKDKKESVIAGYRHLWGDPLLKAVTAMLGAFILTIGVVNTGEVFLIMDELGANETTYGILTALWAVGNLVGSAFLSWKAIHLRWQPRALVLSVWVLGTGILGIAIVPELWMIGVLNALTGIGSAVLHTVAGSILMVKTPEPIRGRVNAAFSGIVSFGSLIATAFAGVAIAAWGVREVMIVGSVLALATLVVWGRSVYRAPLDISIDRSSDD
jgi:MFS family permease